jgi:hypothetical protein
MFATSLALSQLCKTRRALLRHRSPSPTFASLQPLAHGFQGECLLFSNRFIHTAVAYFVTGVALGTYKRANQDFRITHVHAHLNLPGWVALALAGRLHTLHPHLQRG